MRRVSTLQRLPSQESYVEDVHLEKEASNYPNDPEKIDFGVERVRPGRQRLTLFVRIVSRHVALIVMIICITALIFTWIVAP